MILKKIISTFLFVFFITSIVFGQQKASIYGLITDKNGKAVHLATISIVGGNGTLSSEDGKYYLELKAKEEFTLVFSHAEFQQQSYEMKLAVGEKKEMNITLEAKTVGIAEVNVVDEGARNYNVHVIDPKLVSVIPSASGDFLSILSAMPGVSKGNELSSQYSVRGGNFDENLVYVNDIEVFRPFLVRSGQQEGLSFINSDLVSAVTFSAGGFEAKYGDKMSSVLDITYKKPLEFASSVSMSLLGGAAHIEGCSKNVRFTYLSGIRYKTSQYMLNSLETSGEYKPAFFDFQTYLTFDVNSEWELSLLANLASNSFNFVPEMRSTDFGTNQNALNFTMYFDGKEVDKFESYMSAFTANYRPVNYKMNLKFIASAYQTNEKETFDILTEYFLNELGKSNNAEAEEDTSINLGIGSYLKHARNYLVANVYNVSHRGYWTYNDKGNEISWGVQGQFEQIDDKLNEWKMIDSAGYSIPYSGSEIAFTDNIHSENYLETMRLTGYLQHVYKFSDENNEYFINSGIRAHYWSYTNQTVVSPRIVFAYKPSNWVRKDSSEIDILFRFSTGIYYQPPFYKELRNHQGLLNPDIMAQRSIHFLGGVDYNFLAWGRPFKFVGEVYYKILDNLIPYEVDNVRIRYYANEIAKGYATGIDMKVNGEFVAGVESWASLSLMQTKEDVLNDGHGYISRPTDQLVNAGMFFQDYFPNNDSYKMSLSFLYGSRLTHGPPNTARYMAVFSIPQYIRVDIGFSKVILDENHPNRRLQFFKSIWITGEVFNLLGVSNTVSYDWVYVVQNANTTQSGFPEMFGIPNRLTTRLLNLRLICKF